MYTGGPYIVPEGQPVTMDCEVHANNSVLEGSMLGWSKVGGSKSSFFERQPTAEEYYTKPFSFPYTLNASVSDNGQYFCYLDTFPHRHKSNLTELTAEGKDFIVMLLLLRMMMMTIIINFVIKTILTFIR